MSDIVKIGDATLYCMDALEFCESSPEVDVIITDPPYGINGGSGTLGKARKKSNYVGDWDDTPEYIELVIAPIFAECLKRAKRAAITTGGKCSGFYPHPDVIGGFFQPAATGLCKWGSVNFQSILFYGSDPRIGKKITPIVVTLNEAGDKNGHPCAKPIKAWTWLVNKASLEGETVLDPFMGSGTTGVACANLGRKFIGIELEREYFDIACERIEAAYAQGRLFA